MPNQVINIPHRVIPWAFQNDSVEELRLLCILKARAGRFVLDELSQPQVEIMVRMGWLVPSGGKLRSMDGRLSTMWSTRRTWHCPASQPR